MSKIIVETDDKTHFLFKKYCTDRNRTIRDVILAYINRCIKYKHYDKNAKNST